MLYSLAPIKAWGWPSTIRMTARTPDDEARKVHATQTRVIPNFEFLIMHDAFMIWQRSTAKSFRPTATTPIEMIRYSIILKIKKRLPKAYIVASTKPMRT